MTNKFRSVLTVLGIIIGVAAVISVVSIVTGVSRSVTRSFDALGANTLTVQSKTSFKDQLKGKSNRVTVSDYEYLARNLDGVRDISPSFTPFGSRGVTARSEAETSFTRAVAVTSTYQDTNQSYPSYGRFISSSDVESRRKVAVIGKKLRDNLQLPENPIGKFINVEGAWFKIVGVMEERGELFGVSQDDYVLIPFSVGAAYSTDPLSQDISITLTVHDIQDIEEVQFRSSQILRKRHGIAAGGEDDFKVQTAQQLKDSFGKILDSIAYGMAGIVGVSLFVGGIGIMNIMLVSVKERTREIGICKALGARRSDILLLFLVEATLLSLIGGLLGLALGWGLGALASVLIPSLPDAVVPVWAALLAVGSSTAIGLTFGVVPAAQAAGLNPIDALRHE